MALRGEVCDKENQYVSMIDLVGIGNLLEHLVAADNITCEGRDRIILRIAKENDIAEYALSALAGYGKSKSDVLECAARRKNSVSQDKKQDESYLSLTEIARAHSEDAPGYVIQSWLRSGNTLAFFNLWGPENNLDYSEAGYMELLEKKKAPQGNSIYFLVGRSIEDKGKSISREGSAEHFLFGPYG